MRRVVIGLTGGLLVAASLAGAASAQGHQHRLNTPGEGEPLITQAFCMEQTETGFENFHSNVHAVNGNNGVMSVHGEPDLDFVACP